MATEKSCSGSTVLLLFRSGDPMCDYQLSLLIDGVPITTQVTVNSGTPDPVIQSDLNSNRINNTTGTISVVTVGTNLEFTITGIVLPIGSLGLFSYDITPGAFPCGTFPADIPNALVCSVIPTPSKRKRKLRGVFPPILCINKFDNQGRQITCPDTRLFGNITYEKISDDGKKCCYKISK